MTEKEIDLLYELMENAKDEETKATLRKAIFLLEQMEK